MAETGTTQGPGRLSVVSTATDGMRVLTVAGEIDHHTVGALQKALSADAGASPRTVADMRQVTFMDSTGINALIAAHHQLTRAGGWLRLAGPQAPVMRIVELVGVDAVIPCHPTLREALTP
ncbi:STAS domain-containing protein [Streptomyces sp. NPDC046831]|uniref:STAS domain-containing protein n=1 Tax=Streptomyces sp. NPDC046831 TaxID=3154805 RepID=UPI0034055A0F